MDREIRKRPPSSHSKVTLPGTTPSSIGWVASVVQVPISPAKGRMSGSLPFMPMPTGRRRGIIGRASFGGNGVDRRSALGLVRSSPGAGPQLAHDGNRLVDVALPAGDHVGVGVLADPDDDVGEGRAVDREGQPTGVDLLGQQSFDDGDRPGLDAGGLQGQRPQGHLRLGREEPVQRRVGLGRGEEGLQRGEDAGPPVTLPEAIAARACERRARHQNTSPSRASRLPTQR